MNMKLLNPIIFIFNLLKKPFLLILELLKRLFPAVFKIFKKFFAAVFEWLKSLFTRAPSSGIAYLQKRRESMVTQDVQSLVKASQKFEKKYREKYMKLRQELPTLEITPRDRAKNFYRHYQQSATLILPDNPENYHEEPNEEKPRLVLMAKAAPLPNVLRHPLTTMEGGHAYQGAEELISDMKASRREVKK